MPFRSEAQRRKFYALAKQGKISQDEVQKWEKETGNKKLPERLGQKKLIKVFSHLLGRAR